MGRGLGDATESLLTDISKIAGPEGALRRLGAVGLPGIDGDGELSPGFALESIDETVGEISGRNLQREALAQSNDRATEEEANRATLLEQEQERARLLDVQASQAAGTLRTGSGSARSGAANLRSATLAEDGDFLGL